MRRGCGCQIFWRFFGGHNFHLMFLVLLFEANNSPRFHQSPQFPSIHFRNRRAGDKPLAIEEYPAATHYVSGRGVKANVT